MGLRVGEMDKETGRKGEVKRKGCEITGREEAERIGQERGLCLGGRGGEVTQVAVLERRRGEGKMW